MSTPLSTPLVRRGTQIRHPLLAVLRARRIALGLSCREIARATGYTRESISNWENGRANPTLRALAAYAAAVDARIDLVPLSPQPLQITDSVVGLRADHHDSARLTRNGQSANQIALANGCSQRTVQRHRARAREEARNA